MLSEVETHTTEKLIDILLVKSKSATLQFNIVIVTVTVSLTVSSGLIGWSAYKTRKMMQKIQKFTERLGKKTKELMAEQQKGLFQNYAIS